MNSNQMYVIDSSDASLRIYLITEDRMNNPHLPSFV